MTDKEMYSLLLFDRGCNMPVHYLYKTYVKVRVNLYVFIFIIRQNSIETFLLFMYE